MEQHLSDFASTYTQGIIIASVIFLALFLARFIHVIKYRDERKWLWKSGADWLVIALKALFFIGLIAFLADIPVWFLVVAYFRPLAVTWIQNLFIFILIAISVQEIILCFTATDSLVTKFIKRILFLLVSIFCSFSFILAAFIVPGTYVYPAVSESVLLDLPVKGTWLAMHAGAQKWENYHCNYPPQMYAIDMVKLNDNNAFYQNTGADTSDHFAFADSVFAPVAGVVHATADGFAAQVVMHGEDTINPAGNFIEIELPQQQYLFLAHLKAGTLQVKSGDTIAVGQFLALAGNSGNTTFPHLHMHIQDKPLLNDTLSTGKPFRFKTMERKRFLRFERLENEFLIRNDQFRN